MHGARTALVAAALVLAASTAQSAWSQGDVDQKLRQLESKLESVLSELQAVKSENQELRGTVARLSDDMAARTDEPAGDQSELERAINDLRKSEPTTFSEQPLLTRKNGFIDHMIWGGEWRTRVDYRHNTADLLDDIDDDGVRLDYRFNLGLGFVFQPEQREGGAVPKIRTWFEIQAAGRGANNTAESIPSGLGVSVGDFATRDNDLDIVRLYQAWIELDNMFSTEGLRLTIGRQEIRLGSELIIGTNEFFTGTVHDAVRLDFDIEAIQGKFHTFYAKEAASDGQVPPGLSTGGLSNGRFRSSGDEDELAAFYSEWGFLKPLSLDLYYIYYNARSAGSSIAPDNQTSPNDPAVDAFGLSTLEGQINTIGTWLHEDDMLLDGLYLGLETAFQFGEAEDGDSLDSFLVEFTGEYALPVESDMAPSVYFSYYFAEGPDAGLRNGFSTFFISRHNNVPVFNGEHGPFSRFGNVDMIPSLNVHVFQLGFRFNPDPNWTLGLSYLYSMANHSRSPFTINPLGTVFLDDRGIGHEIDLYGQYKIDTHAYLFLNFSVFVPDADFSIQPVSDPNGPLQAFDTEVAVGVFAQIQVRF
jgi:hypothetical protein